ncbi:unnamed protein product, partial [Brachionus calyciflorus]
MERRRKIGQKVEFSDEKPRKILHELNDNNLDDEMIANSANYSPNPEKLSEIYFPDFLTITKKKENFLFFDSGGGLLSRKTEEMYVEFLNAVQIKLKHDPLSITSDFEKAFINASMKVFPK